MPRRRVTSNTESLPPSETAICLRVKEARERLGLDQSEVARRVGLKNHAISNVEKCAAPLRCDLALRICRELIISEEWLATGHHAAADAALKKTLGGMTIDPAIREAIFFRQVVDLHSEPTARAVPPRTLFSAAYHDYLAPAYAAALKKNLVFAPRIVSSEHDRPELSREVLSVLLERFEMMLAFRAHDLGYSQLDGEAGRELLRYVSDAAVLIFMRCMGWSTQFQTLPNFEFLRAIMRDETTPIGILNGEEFTETELAKMAKPSRKRRKTKRQPPPRNKL